MNQEKIEITVLENFPSVLEGIFYFSQISKAQLKKFKISKNYLNKKLLKGDVLSLPIDIINYLKISPCYEGEIEILFEDQNMIALSKPFNVHSHPLTYSETDNILSALYQAGKWKELTVNDQHYDRGLMYRLDYATSGLLIYLKSKELYTECRENYQDKMISKCYMAVVVGELEDSELKHKLMSSGVKGAKIVEGSSEIDEVSSIKTQLLEYNKEKNLSLILVYLGRGKRHQIRAQLSIAKHPILGDKLYGSESDRLYLHCFEYQFSLNGKKYEIQDKNTDDLTKFFNFNS